uniref:Uncharacterized protein n=1 Tax=Paramormyrops kingsleyae TaxID=1676925 RepID=A0A3B3S9N3_9TELE
GRVLTINTLICASARATIKLFDVSKETGSKIIDTLYWQRGLRLTLNRITTTHCKSAASEITTELHQHLCHPISTKTGFGELYRAAIHGRAAICTSCHLSPSPYIWMGLYLEKTSC